MSAANAGWVEGTRIATGFGEDPTGMSTWNHRIEPTVNWAGSPSAGTPGVDYTTQIGSLAFPAGLASGTPVDITFTDPSVIAAWNVGNNPGIFLRTANEPGGRIVFWSAQASPSSGPADVTAHHPELIISYAPTCGQSAPVAVIAGGTSTVTINTLVSLDASGSHDPDNDSCALNQTLAYDWSFAQRPVGSSALLSDPHSATPSFIADKLGDYQVQLVVTDSTGRSSPPAFVTITSSQCGAYAPVVHSIVASSHVIGSPATLTADVTDDDNTAACGNRGQTFTYAWTLTTRPPGSSSLLNDPHSVTPSFTPDVVGDYQVRLVVTDSTGLSSAPKTLTLIWKKSRRTR